MAPTELPTPEFCEAYDEYQRNRRNKRKMAPALAARKAAPKAWKELLAVAEREFPRPFGLSALVFAAWVKNQKMFGLAGMEGQYPCSHRVRCHLYGPHGLIAKGKLRRLPNGLFEVVRGN